MSYLFKLSRRVAMSRYLPGMMALLVTLAACTAGDSALSPSEPDPTDDPSTLTAARLLPESLFVRVGQAVQLASLGPVLDEPPTVVEWSATGGTITPSGLFTASAEGEYKVARGRGKGRNKKNDTTVVVVTPAELESLSVSPDSVALAPGEQRSFTAQGRFSDGTVAPVPALWRATGGTVDAAGTYTAGTAAGGYRLIATSTEGPADTATVVVRVSEPPQPELAGLLLTPSTVSLAPGESQRFAAQGVLSDGSRVPLVPRYTATGGTISAAGDYLAGSTSGSFRVIAADSSGAWADTAAVTIQAPAPPPPPPPSGESCARTVTVATASQLSAALAGARPGDCIRMADGVYAGWFRATESGTATQPIRLTGSRNAVIDGGSIHSGGAALQLWASYWIVEGFTIRNRMDGLEIRGGRGNVVRDLELHTLGHHGIHLWVHARRNLVEGVWIHDAGKRTAEYGEGVYLGSAPSKWSTAPLNGPDRTDSNTIRGNRFGPNITAEHIDAKEGTAWNRIEGNTFDGRGQVNDPATYWVDSWVEINGDDYVVTGNRGINRALKHGFQTYRGPNGWGNRTYYANNTADLGGASGYGFVMSQSPSGVTVRCDNVAQNAGSGLSNVGCK